MTTRRSYSCNLCHKGVNDGSGVGLVWKDNKTIRLTVPSSAETHICQSCLDGVEAAIEDQRKHSRLRDEATQAT